MRSHASVRGSSGRWVLVPIQPSPRPSSFSLTVRCEYPDSYLEPTCVSFRLSTSYGIRTAREAHDWFLRMMQEHEEFEVDEAPNE